MKQLTIRIVTVVCSLLFAVSAYSQSTATTVSATVSATAQDSAMVAFANMVKSFTTLADSITNIAEPLVTTTATLLETYANIVAQEAQMAGLVKSMLAEQEATIQEQTIEDAKKYASLFFDIIESATQWARTATDSILDANKQIK